MGMSWYRIWVKIFRKAYPRYRVRTPEAVYVRANTHEEAFAEADKYAKYLLNINKGCEYEKAVVSYCQHDPDVHPETYNRGAQVYIGK